MLDIHHIEQNPHSVIKKLLSRGEETAQKHITDLVDQNEQRRKLQLAHDNLLYQLKQSTKQVATLLAKGDKKTAEVSKQAIKNLKLEAKNLLQKLKQLTKHMQDQLLALPNLPHSSVPKGKSYTDNTIISTWPKPGGLPQTTQPHWELLSHYQLASFEEGNKITGAGFPVYHNKGARLQRGLINFFLDQALKNDYQEIQPPLIVNSNSAMGTGQIPDKENTMYALQGQNMYLIPTAEVPLTNIYSNKTLQEKELPIKKVAYTPCFRQEAGSWGRQVRGLNRLHQFDKVELVEIHTPDTSQHALEKMLKYVTTLLQKLELPHRILKLCTRELGFAAALTYDVEVWSSGQKQWLEVSSITLFETFQARRMNLRYQKENKKYFCHTLNASALALPRVLAALLENFQTSTAIHIPKVLHPYINFQKIEN